MTFDECYKDEIAKLKRQINAQARRKGGVITVVPNKVAHLCKLVRERDVTIMCGSDAFDKFNALGPRLN